MRYITSLELYERRQGRNEERNDLLSKLSKLKNAMPKDQYDKMVPSLQLELQELRTKSAALVTQ